MEKIELKLINQYPKKLGTAPTAKKIFSEINSYEEAILNFRDIEFMSRSFAQEYIVQKHLSQTKIIERNMECSIKKLLEVVEEDYQNTCK